MRIGAARQGYAADEALFDSRVQWAWLALLGLALVAFPFVANDYCTLAGYEVVRAQGGERASDPFWRPLARLIDDAGVPRHACFFTNAIMGLRAQGGATGDSMGRSPGFADPERRVAPRDEDRYTRWSGRHADGARRCTSL